MTGELERGRRTQELPAKRVNYASEEYKCRALHTLVDTVNPELLPGSVGSRAGDEGGSKSSRETHFSDSKW